MGLVGFTDSAGQVAQAEAPYGTRKYLGKLSLMDHLNATELVPPISSAVKKAENNKRNHGVLSVTTSSSSDAEKVLDNSVYNNMVRWIQAGRPGKFVDFMQQRWAPRGVSNDPKDLNKNWAPNVRKFLKQDPNVDYDVLKSNNIVLNQSPLGAFSV